MKKVLYISNNLLTSLLRTQCDDIGEIFANNSLPTTEQIEDLHEITRAWLADMPDTYQEKFNNGFATGFEMAHQLAELDAVATEAGSATFAPREPVSGFSVTFNVDENLDETARKAVEAESQPEAEEDPFRYHVRSSEIPNSSPNPVICFVSVDCPETPDSSNSSGNSNSSNDSEAGVTNPTNLISEPVEKNSQPNKEKRVFPNKSKRFAESEGVTLADMELAIEGHGTDSFAKFCGCSPRSALAAFATARRHGYPGPKCVEWVKSLSGQTVNKAAQPKPNKVRKQKPAPEPTEVRKECIPWARARVVCRVRTADGRAETRLLERWINSGSTDIEWFLKNTFTTGSTGVWV